MRSPLAAQGTIYRAPTGLSLPINAEFLDPSSPGFLQVLILKNLVLLEVV